jgi:hypothetical protein
MSCIKRLIIIWCNFMKLPISYSMTFIRNQRCEPIEVLTPKRSASLAKGADGHVACQTLIKNCRHELNNIWGLISKGDFRPNHKQRFIKAPNHGIVQSHFAFEHNSLAAMCCILRELSSSGIDPPANCQSKHLRFTKSLSQSYRIICGRS